MINNEYKLPKAEYYLQDFVFIFKQFVNSKNDLQVFVNVKINLQIFVKLWIKFVNFYKQEKQFAVICLAKSIFSKCLFGVYKYVHENAAILNNVKPWTRLQQCSQIKKCYTPKAQKKN